MTKCKTIFCYANNQPRLFALKADSESCQYFLYPDILIGLWSCTFVKLWSWTNRRFKKNDLCLEGVLFLSFFDSLLFLFDRLLFTCLLCLWCLCFSSDSLSDPTEEENWEDDSWELRDESAECEVRFLLPSSTETRNITAGVISLKMMLAFKNTTLICSERRKVQMP